MPYTKPVVEDDGTLFTVAQWRHDIRQTYLIDYDGWGYPVKDGLMDTTKGYYPSEQAELPRDATHVMWFNR